MTIDFKYNIGDYVASVLELDSIKQYLLCTKVLIRPDLLRIEERHVVECIGGIQLFYTCRNREGITNKHSEESLVTSDTLWKVWLEGVLAQEQRGV